MRALLDTKKIKSAEKRWNWVRRGAPIIVEIGPRDAAAGQVTYMRRDALRDGDKIASHAAAARTISWPGRRRCWPRSRPASTPRPRRGSTTTSSTDITTFDELAEYFGAGDDEDEGGAFKGWVRVALVEADGRGAGGGRRSG